MLAGGGEWPNEGHFRPIEVVTRPGSLFHPLPPAPTFIGGWAAIGAIDAIYRALGEALAGSVPASSGGDICSLVWWGRRTDGEPWADGSPYPVGQGGSAFRDGANAVMHVSESATRIAPTEVSESRNPWLVEHVELAPDSGGAGEYRGGNGMDLRIRLLEDAELTSVVDRTRTAPAGLAGGAAARPNAAELVLDDGRRIPCAKATRLAAPAGSVLELRTGGGGGYGDPADRDPTAVQSDLREGYVSEGRARRDYPHAFTTEG
jgi:N-methylhydantoinase B